MSTPATAGAENELRRRWGVPRFGYWGNRMMLGVGSRILWAGYVLVWAVAGYFFLFVPQARRGSMKYLDRLRGGRPGRGIWRRGWETYRHLVEFGYLLLDRAVMLRRTTHGFAMCCEGMERLQQALAEGRGLIMLTGHFGNAEAAAPYMRQMGMGRPMHLVMYQDSRDATERFHAEHRKLLSEMEVITTTDPLAAGVKIIRVLRAGEVVAIRADRKVGGRGMEAELLGAKVELPAGPFVAAALSGAPVVQVYTCRLGYRKYVCVISAGKSYGEETGGTQEERALRAANDYAYCLEGMLREHPYQWGNFYDFWAVQDRDADSGEKKQGQ